MMKKQVDEIATASAEAVASSEQPLKVAILSIVFVVLFVGQGATAVAWMRTDAAVSANTINQSHLLRQADRIERKLDRLVAVVEAHLREPGHSAELAHVAQLERRIERLENDKEKK